MDPNLAQRVTVYLESPVTAPTSRELVTDLVNALIQARTDKLSEIIAWADASEAVTWAGKGGLKERLLYPERFKEAS